MWRIPFFRGAENFISDPEGFLIHHKWTWNVVNIELQQVSSRRLSLTRQILETDTLPFRKLCKSTARKRDEWKNQTKFNCRLHDLFRQRDFFFLFVFHHRQIHSRGWHDENFFNFSLKLRLLALRRKNIVSRFDLRDSGTETGKEGEKVECEMKKISF